MRATGLRRALPFLAVPTFVSLHALMAFSGPFVGAPALSREVLPTAALFVAVLLAAPGFARLSGRGPGAFIRPYAWTALLLLAALRCFSVVPVRGSLDGAPRGSTLGLALWLLLPLLVLRARAAALAPSLLSVAGARVGRLAGSRGGIVLAFMALSAFALAQDVRLAREWVFTGDEPHYLLAARSLLLDRDLDLKDDYDTREYADFHPDELPDRHVVRVAGRERPHHPIGVAILEIPFLHRLGDLPLPRLPMNALYLVHIYILFRTLVLLLEDRAKALGLACAAGLMVPLATYSGQVYPELPGAVLSGCALYLLLRADRRGDGLGGGEALTYSALLALLPWFHMRFMTLLLPLYALPFLLLRWDRRRLLLYHLPLGLSAVLLAAFHFRLYGSVLGPAASEPLFSSPLGIGVPGLLLDRAFGLLVHAPFYVFSFAGLALMLRRERRLLLTLGVVFLPSFVTIAGYAHWFTGWPPVGRYMVVWIEALIIPAALYFRAPRRGSQLAFLALTLAWGFFVTGFLWTHPAKAFHDDLTIRWGTSPLLTHLSGPRLDLNHCFPGLLNPDDHTLLKLVFWAAVTAATAAWLLRPRAERREARTDDLRAFRRALAVDLAFTAVVLTLVLLAGRAMGA